MANSGLAMAAQSCSLEERPLQEIITHLHERGVQQERDIAELKRRADAAETRRLESVNELMQAQDRAAEAAAEREDQLIAAINTKLDEYRTDMLATVKEAKDACDKCERRIVAQETAQKETADRLTECEANVKKMNDAVAKRITEECDTRFAEAKALVEKRTDKLGKVIQAAADQRMAEMDALRAKLEAEVDKQATIVAGLQADFVALTSEVKDSTAALQTEVATVAESHKAQVPIVSDLRATVNLNFPDLWAKHKELSQKVDDAAEAAARRKEDVDTRIDKVGKRCDRHVAQIAEKSEKSTAQLAERADTAAGDLQRLKETLSRFTTEVENGLNEVKQASAKEAAKLKKTCQDVWDRTKEQLTSCQDCIRGDIDGVKLFIEEHRHEVEGKIDKKVRGVRKQYEAAVEDVRGRIADVARQAEEGLLRRDDADMTLSVRMNDIDRKIDAMDRQEKERVRTHNQLADSLRSQTEYILGELDRKVLCAQERAEKHVDKRVLSVTESLEKETRTICGEEAALRQEQLQALLSKIEQSDVSLRQDLTDVRQKSTFLEKSVHSVYNLFGIDRSVGGRAEQMTANERVQVLCSSPAFVALKSDVLLNQSHGSQLAQTSHAHHTSHMHHTPSPVVAGHHNALDTPTPVHTRRENLAASWLSPNAAANTTMTRAELGLSVRGNPGRRGAEVTHVVRHSVADRSGLCRGDRILYINGQKVDTEYDFDVVVQSTPGAEMKITHIPAGGDHPTTVDVRA